MNKTRKRTEEDNFCHNAHWETLNFCRRWPRHPSEMPRDFLKDLQAARPVYVKLPVDRTKLLPLFQFGSLLAVHFTYRQTTTRPQLSPRCPRAQVEFYQARVTTAFPASAGCSTFANSSLSRSLPCSRHPGGSGRLAPVKVAVTNSHF